MEVRWRWEREVRVLRRERRVGRFLEKRRFWSNWDEALERFFPNSVIKPSSWPRSKLIYHRFALSAFGVQIILNVPLILCLIHVLS